MSITKLRKKAKDTIESLPPDRLRAAVHYLNYLHDADHDPATEELLRIPGLVKRIRAAERDVAAGRTTPWEKVRRDV